MSLGCASYARIAHGHILRSVGHHATSFDAGRYVLSSHAYTLRCMIIRWREWSSDRHGGQEPARASTMMSLTQQSLFPFAYEVVNACRSVHNVPSSRTVKQLRRTRSKHLRAFDNMRARYWFIPDLGCQGFPHQAAHAPAADFVCLRAAPHADATLPSTTPFTVLAQMGYCRRSCALSHSTRRVL